MKPKVRTAVTLDGDIEAVIPTFGHPMPRLTIDRRTGAVRTTTHLYGSQEFRWMVTEARKHVTP